MSQQDVLLALRGLLLPLAESFEVDPARTPAAGGLLARIPVVGGRFLHPLTREAIGSLRVYAAGPDRVKILEPSFLRSLPPFAVAGLTQPAQLCALAARALGEALGELGRLRDALRAMGLALDLERDVLRLRGRAVVAGAQVELLGLRPAGLAVVALEGRSLAGRAPFEERTLALSGEPDRDADVLGALVAALVRRLAPGAPAQPSAPAAVEELQPLDPEQDYAPEVKPHLAAAVAGLRLPGDLSDAAPAEVVELTELAEEPPPASRAEDLRPAVAVPPPVPPVAAPAPPAASAPPASEGGGTSLGALPLEELLDLFGSATQVSAFAGKLRLVAPLKVVQGEFTFYLEQSAARVFRGFLVSPQGHRYPVELDLAEVYDLKAVFDRVMMGR